MAVTLDKMFSALVSTDLNASVANSLLSSGTTLMEQKKYKQAAAAFRQAAAMQPDNIDAYNLMGQAYVALGDRKNAIAAYKISTQLDNTQDSVYVNLANVYIDDKNYSAAAQALKAAYKANPANAVAHYTLGQIYAQQGKLVEAQAEFNQTARLSPKDGNPYYALGMVLNKMGKYDDAVKQLQKATQLKKDFEPALYELGKAYSALGQEQNVQAQIDKLKKINTSSSLSSADELTAMITHPKMLSGANAGSSFRATFATVPLVALDPDLVTPGASKDFTMKFTFDTDMNVASVMDITKWSISKSSRATVGLYDNGLYRATDIQVPIMPKQVSYDPTTREATIVFSLTQNADGTGTVDPKNIVFKFMGTDINGKAMDSTADEYSANKKTPF